MRLPQDKLRPSGGPPAAVWALPGGRDAGVLAGERLQKGIADVSCDQCPGQ